MHVELVLDGHAPSRERVLYRAGTRRGAGASLSERLCHQVQASAALDSPADVRLEQYRRDGPARRCSPWTVAPEESQPYHSRMNRARRQHPRRDRRRNHRDHANENSTTTEKTS